MVERASIGGDVRGLAFVVGAIFFSVLARGSAPRREPSRGVRHATAVKKSSVLKLPPVGLPAVASGAAALGTLAIGSLAISALAVSALAIGVLAVGRLEIRKTRLREVEIDNLTVRRFRVVDQPGEGSHA
jgi:hypothetical protein